MPSDPFSLSVLAGVAGIAGTCSLCYLSGNGTTVVRTMVDFGPILGSDASAFCSMTKYNGTSQYAMIVGSLNSSLWWHGTDTGGLHEGGLLWRSMGN